LQEPQGLLFSDRPGATPDRGEGPDGGHSRGLRARHLGPLGQRPEHGHGRHRHLEKPGLAAVRGDRRARPGLPDAADRGPLAPSPGRPTYLRSRQGGRIVSVAVIVDVAVDTDGRRPRGHPGPRRFANRIDGLWPSMVLGVPTGASEVEVFWTGSFARSPIGACPSRAPARARFADRIGNLLTLDGVKLVIADDHKGLRAAARRVWHPSSAPRWRP
jgi:hypothetical protein